MALANDLRMTVLKHLYGGQPVSSILDWLASHVQAVHDEGQAGEDRADRVWLTVDEFQDGFLDEATFRSELLAAVGMNPVTAGPAPADRIAVTLRTTDATQLRATCMQGWAAMSLSRSHAEPVAV